MAEDWAADVRKYAPDADEAVIAGLVRHCGIALRSREASLVAFSDATETDRVRENFLKKKLARTEPDSVLDAAVAAVGQRMKADRTKNRVTVYYLLAEAFGTLEVFISAKAAKERAAAMAPEPKPAPQPQPAPQPKPFAAPAPTLFDTPAPVAAPAAVPAPVAAPAPVMAAVPPAPPAAPPVLVDAPVAASRTSGAAGRGLWVLWVLLPLAVLVLGGAGLFMVISAPKAAPVAPVVAAAALLAAPAVPAAPQGDAVVAAERDGVPMLQVFFALGSAMVAESFGSEGAAMLAFAQANPDQQLIVSGYNDPSGDAAANAELSKNRAQAVAAALVAAGVAEDRVVLEKPPETSDEDVSLEQARRVDVVMR